MSINYLKYKQLQMNLPICYSFYITINNSIQNVCTIVNNMYTQQKELMELTVINISHLWKWYSQ